MIPNIYFQILYLNDYIYGYDTWSKNALEYMKSNFLQ